MAVKYNFELNNNITLLSSKQFEQILSSDHYIKNGNDTNQEVYDIKSNKLRAIYNEFTNVEMDNDYRKISDHIESYINNPYRSTDIYNESWAFEDRGFELLKVPKNTQIYKSPAIYEPGQIDKPISYFSNAKTAAMYWKKYAGAFINYNINQDIILFVNSDANLRIILNDDNTPQTVKDAINMLYIVTENNNIVESTKYYNKNVAYIHYLYKIVQTDREKVYGYYNIPLLINRQEYEKIISEFVIKYYGVAGIIYPRAAAVNRLKPIPEYIAINPIYATADLSSPHTRLNYDLVPFSYNKKTCSSHNVNYNYNKHFYRGLINAAKISDKWQMPAKISDKWQMPALQTNETTLSIFTLNVLGMKSINALCDDNQILADFITVIKYQNADICSFQEAPLAHMHAIYEREFKAEYPFYAVALNAKKTDDMGLFVMFKGRPENLEIIKYQYANSRHRDYIICRYGNVHVAFCHIEYFTFIYPDQLPHVFINKLDKKELGQVEVLTGIVNNLNGAPNAVLIGDFNFRPCEEAFTFLTSCGFNTMDTPPTVVNNTISDYGWARGLAFNNTVFNYHHSDHNGLRMELNLNNNPAVDLSYNLNPIHDVKIFGGSGFFNERLIIAIVILIILILLFGVIYLSQIFKPNFPPLRQRQVRPF